MTRNPDRRRYEASVGETTVAGFIDYQETSEMIVLTHTEVDPTFEESAAPWPAPRSTISANED
ncbi:GNAT family N-acetyltransferase [Streptomyces chlorus]|uniref:GNAT family N-acetyltransferase n=1 Tax=Streptomyces chlorus TaxID=887452 RepID=A0ABW1E701_9ACTN